MRYTSRALLCVVLLVGLYLLAAAVVGGLVTLVVLGFRLGLGAYALIKIGVPLLFVAFLVVRAALQRPERGEPGGLLVSDSDQPALWAEVRALAAEVGTRPPDEIRLVLDVNAAVSEESRLLGLLGGTRRMYVGVPLLLALSPLEVRAVLAHELGHYSARHTALAPVTYRGLEALGRVCNDLGPDTIFGRVFGAYGRLYARVAHGVGRQQEIEADRFAVAAAGTRATTAALETLLPLEAAWQTYLARYAPLGAPAGTRPAPLLQRFTDFLADPEVLADLARFADEHEEVAASPYDTHPPMSERVARIREVEDPGTVAAPSDLLTAPTATLAVLEERLFDGSDRTPGEWDDVVTAAVVDQATRSAGELGRLVAAADHRPGSIRRAVDFLVRPLRPGLIDGAPLEDEPRIVAHLVGDAMALALVRSGAARFAPSWSRSRRLTTPGGDDLDPWQVASDAAGRGSDRLLAWAQEHGIDIDAPLPVGHEEVPSDRPGARPRLLGVVGPLLIGPFVLRRWRVLAVTSEGVAILKVTIGEMYSLSFSRSAGGAGWRASTDRIVRRVAGIDPATIAGARGVRAANWDEVAEISMTQRSRRATRIVFRLVGGTSITTKTDRPTVLGEPFGALERMLGERFRRR